MVYQPKSNTYIFCTTSPSVDDLGLPYGVLANAILASGRGVQGNRFFSITQWRSMSIIKPTYETAKCKHCGKEFQRNAKASRKAQCCRSVKCTKLAKLLRSPGKPVGFESVPNSPSKYRAMIDYHGSYQQ